MNSVIVDVESIEAVYSEPTANQLAVAKMVGQTDVPIAYESRCVLGDKYYRIISNQHVYNLAETLEWPRVRIVVISRLDAEAISGLI